jgi:hypothetical protein
MTIPTCRRKSCVADVARLIIRQADSLQQRSDLLDGKLFALLLRPERNIHGHRPGEEIRALHDHSDVPPQVLRRHFATILAVEADGSARRFVEAVQQPQKRRFTCAARTDHRQDLPGAHRYADVAHQRFVEDRSGKMSGFKSRGDNRGSGDTCLVHGLFQIAMAVGLLKIPSSCSRP